MSGLRNFIIVFLLALLGFGVLGHFIATSIVPSLINGDDILANESTVDSSDDSTEDVNSGDVDSEDTPFVEGNTFNFAFFCKDINDKLVGIYLVHTNDGYETCVSVPIPGDAVVENNGAHIALSKLYEDNGSDFMLTKLYYLTGCKIDEYANLCAVDVDGKGRNITELSTYLKYTYRISEKFEYPNPDYIEGAEESSLDASSDMTGEFIVIEPGSYALNSKTEGVLNEILLLDAEYNPNTFDIYSELINRMINDEGIAANKNKQATIFDYVADKSFRDYEGSGTSAYLFNDFRKASFAYPKTGGAWDEVREAIKTLEGKVQ